MKDWAELLVDRARTEGVELTGEGGLLTGLVRQVLQTGLEVEMAEHLGYERHAVGGRGSGNSRNGTTPKTVTTEIGQVDLRVPRDRAGTFAPVTVPKHRRRLDGLSGNVISLYAKGLTTGEIQAHLEEIYDTEVSRETISKITDEIVADMAVWQNRPVGAGNCVVAGQAAFRYSLMSPSQRAGFTTWRCLSGWSGASVATGGRWSSERWGRRVL